MLLRFGSWSIFFAIMIYMFSSTASAEDMSRTDDFIVSSKGIKTVLFTSMVFTDLIYKGKYDTDTFTIRFEKIVKTDDVEEFEDIVSRLDLDITTSDRTVTIDLKHPENERLGLFKRMLHRKEWRVKLEITGPSNINLEMNADFSEIHTSFTRGNIVVNSNFSEVRCEELDGTFDVNSDFSDVTLELTHLAGNSQVKTTFGSTDIRLPQNTGAVFHIDKTLASVNFNISGSLTHEGNKGSRRVLNRGGPRIDLGVEFGKISVKDNQQNKRISVEGAVDEADRFFPLINGAWWNYSSGDENLMLKVENIRDENGNNTATLSFDKNEASPFESIDVFETEKGLYISAINGRYYGRDLSGVRFTPAKLWLPYDSNVESGGGDVIGTVRIEALEDTLETAVGPMNNALQYTLEYLSFPREYISLVPGVGFVSFGYFKLTDYDLGISKSKPLSIKHPKPQFEKGEVTSIRITIPDEYLVSEPDVTDVLNITRGKTYSREEINEAVSSIDEKNRFIKNANYTIDNDGHLIVTVYEIDPLKRDIGITGSFSRIAGIGLGPTFTLTSVAGPVSEIYGEAQYHWANRDWTYNARAEKSMFETNQLAFGATYRLEYESALDWAIPPKDSHLNAFFLGRETKHYYQVEGATGYVSFSRKDRARLQVEYFTEDFSSVKKHTNWSIFNSRHVKEDNLLLKPPHEGTLVGMRYLFDTFHRTSLMNSTITIEAEQAYDWGGSTLGEYTRFLGNTVLNWSLTRNDMLKLRIAGGYSDDLLPPQKAFRLGGLNTLRGYDFESIPRMDSSVVGNNGTVDDVFLSGGNRMALCNLEYFFGHHDNIGYVVFADAGNVWPAGDSVDFKELKRDIGIGLTLGGDFFSFRKKILRSGWDKSHDDDGLRINWAVPVGNVPHVSHWTVNFVMAY